MNKIAESLNTSSIHTRIVMTLLVLGLIPMLIVISSTHTSLRRTLLDEAYGKVKAQTAEVGRGLSRSMEEADTLIKRLANQPVFKDEQATPEQYEKALYQFQDVYGIFIDLTLYSETGDILATTSKREQKNVKQDKWFYKVLGGKATVLPPAVLDDLGEPGLSFYTPVKFSQGAVRYVLNARMTMSDLWAKAYGNDFPDHGFVMLVDVRNTILAHPMKGLIGTQTVKTRDADYLIRHQQGIYTTDNEQEHLYVARFIGPGLTRIDEPWLLVGMQPRQQVMTTIWDATRIQIATTGTIILLMLLAGIEASRRFSLPFSAASRAADRVAKGDLDVEVAVEGPHEVRLMAQAFNTMVAQVKAQHNSLESKVVQGTLKVYESQTQFEQAAAQLRATYESMQEALVIIGIPSGTILSANHRTEELFGIDLSRMKNTSYTNFFAAIKKNLVEGEELEKRWQYFSQHPTEGSTEEWEMNGNGRRSLGVFTAPVKDHRGDTFARLWTFKDLSAHRSLEAQLRQAQKMEAVGRLAGGIAHDFNNLLTAIIGNLTMAEMDAGAQAKSFIKPAQTAATRASQLVKQLSGFSRHSQLQLKSCDVNSVLQEVLGLLKHTIDPLIEINTEPNTTLWRAFVDPTQLNQVMMNLLVNAADALPEGGQVQIDTQNVTISRREAGQWTDAEPGDYIKIMVADNGTGMPDQVREHIFEPFFTTKDPGKGTGLGLAMSYGIIQQHGGWITCDSAVGQGSTFTIYLPKIGADAALKEEENTKSAKPESKTPAKGGNELILIVDDEQAVRCLTSSMLKRFGYSTLEASDGAEAVSLYREEHYQVDMILLDYSMPKMSGSEAFRLFREIRKDIPIIISSGYPIDLDSFAEEAGSRPNSFVQKPYVMNALAEAVRISLDAGKNSAVADAV